MHLGCIQIIFGRRYVLWSSDQQRLDHHPQISIAPIQYKVSRNILYDLTVSRKIVHITTDIFKHEKLLRQ